MGLDPQAGPGHLLAIFFRPDQPDAPRPGILNALVLPRPIGWISTVNAAGQTNLAAVNASSIGTPHGFDEFAHAGLTKAPSVTVRPHRVAESPVHLECVLSQIVELESPSPEQPNRMVIGRVTGIHIADAVLVDGRVDLHRLDAIARLGYDQYARVRELFAMTRPRWPAGDA